MPNKELSGKHFKRLAEAAKENLDQLFSNPVNYLITVGLAMVASTTVDIVDHKLGLAKSHAHSLALDSLPISEDLKEYVGRELTSITHEKIILKETEADTYEQVGNSIIHGVVAGLQKTEAGKVWISPNLEEAVTKFFSIGKKDNELRAGINTTIWGHTSYDVALKRYGQGPTNTSRAEYKAYAPLIHEIAMSVLLHGEPPTPRTDVRLTIPHTNITKTGNVIDVELEQTGGTGKKALLQAIAAGNIGTPFMKQTIGKLKYHEAFSSIKAKTKGDDKNAKHSLECTLNLDTWAEEAGSIDAFIIITTDGQENKITAKLSETAKLLGEAKYRTILKTKLEELGIEASIN